MKKFGAFITKLNPINHVSLLPIFILKPEKNCQMGFDENPEIPLMGVKWPRILHKIKEQDNCITTRDEEVEIRNAFTLVL
jgi:hypothetical protein